MSRTDRMLLHLSNSVPPDVTQEPLEEQLPAGLIHGADQQKDDGGCHQQEARGTGNLRLLHGCPDHSIATLVVVRRRVGDALPSS